MAVKPTGVGLAKSGPYPVRQLFAGFKLPSASHVCVSVLVTWCVWLASHISQIVWVQLLQFETMQLQALAVLSKFAYVGVQPVHSKLSSHVEQFMGQLEQNCSLLPLGYVAVINLLANEVLVHSASGTQFVA
jgi:hypothetical protein